MADLTQERLEEIEHRLDALGISLSETTIREVIAAVRARDSIIAEQAERIRELEAALRPFALANHVIGPQYLQRAWLQEANRCLAPRKETEDGCSQPS